MARCLLVVRGDLYVTLVQAILGATHVEGAQRVCPGCVRFHTLVPGAIRDIRVDDTWSPGHLLQLEVRS